MKLIHDLKRGEYWNEGKLYVPLFGKEIDVMADFAVKEEYAEACARHLTELSGDMVDKLCERTIAYYRFMLEEWGEYDFYEQLAEEIKETIPEDVEGREIFRYIVPRGLYIDEPEGEECAYSVECDCVWEPEHGLCWIIRGDRMLYAGPSAGLGPWADEDEYRVIY